MNVGIRITHDSYIVELNGELDASSSVAVDAKIEMAVNSGKPFLLVDCHNLNYISSTGLGVFISHLQTVQRRNLKLVLFGVSPKIKDVFSILGLETLLTFAPDAETAYAICQNENSFAL